MLHKEEAQSLEKEYDSLLLLPLRVTGHLPAQLADLAGCHPVPATRGLIPVWYNPGSAWSPFQQLLSISIQLSRYLSLKDAHILKTFLSRGCFEHVYLGSKTEMRVEDDHFVCLVQLIQ